ncbi:unnamed protein product [Arabis nemorensis]|uniref:MATH domain-containing protein n=1 Tax=Arabis nemorensis TaxID=586526 RepID=A0A565BN92_9BRAS|nr:unnamed protein product [Arabis nemorensis]
MFNNEAMSFEPNRVFGAESPGWAFRKNFGLSKFQEKGFLENDKLIIEVYLDVVEALDREGRDVLEKKKKEIVDINGFRVFASQVTLVRQIFSDHSDIAEDFKPKNQVVKTEYMNVLLGLIETLNKPLHSLSETEISDARSELSELMDEGFKLEWLKKKLEKVSLERNKKSDGVVDGTSVQKLEERVKNFELMDLGSLKLKLDKVSLERKKADDADVSRIQQPEESVKKLELIVSDLKDELEKEKAKSSDAGYLHWGWDDSGYPGISEYPDLKSSDP